MMLIQTNGHQCPLLRLEEEDFYSKKGILSNTLIGLTICNKRVDGSCEHCASRIKIYPTVYSDHCRAQIIKKRLVEKIINIVCINIKQCTKHLG